MSPSIGDIQKRYLGGSDIVFVRLLIVAPESLNMHSIKAGQPDCKAADA
jgi:hypothetical protein